MVHTHTDIQINPFNPPRDLTNITLPNGDTVRIANSLFRVILATAQLQLEREPLERRYKDGTSSLYRAAMQGDRF